MRMKSYKNLLLLDRDFPVLIQYFFQINAFSGGVVLSEWVISTLPQQSKMTWESTETYESNRRFIRMALVVLLSKATLAQLDPTRSKSLRRGMTRFSSGQRYSAFLREGIPQREWPLSPVLWWALLIRSEHNSCFLKKMTADLSRAGFTLDEVDK